MEEKEHDKEKKRTKFVCKMLLKAFLKKFSFIYTTGIYGSYYWYLHLGVSISQDLD